MTQVLTAELRSWIVDQVKALTPPEEVLQSLLAAGWNQGLCVQEILRILREIHGTSASEVALARLLPAAVRVPAPLPEGTVPNVVIAGDREVRVIAALREPRVVVFEGLLSPEECDEMIALSRSRLTRSRIVESETGGEQIHEARTSHGMFFHRGENQLCQRIEARLAALCNWPVENGEGLQVLRYNPGAEYKPHHDYFDPDEKGTPVLTRSGGQRVATIIMYLNNPRAGGSTVFPHAGLDVAPIKGNAVFFSYARPHPSTLTLHGGTPVLEGEKWIATKWLRERRYAEGDVPAVPMPITDFTSTLRAAGGLPKFA